MKWEQWAVKCGATVRKVIEALESPGLKISTDPLHSALGSINFSLHKATFVLNWILSIWLSGWAGSFCILCPLQLSTLIPVGSCGFDGGSRADGLQCPSRPPRASGLSVLHGIQGHREKTRMVCWRCSLASRGRPGERGWSRGGVTPLRPGLGCSGEMLRSREVVATYGTWATRRGCGSRPGPVWQTGG